MGFELKVFLHKWNQFEQNLQQLLFVVRQKSITRDEHGELVQVEDWIQMNQIHITMFWGANHAYAGKLNDVLFFFLIDW